MNRVEELKKILDRANKQYYLENNSELEDSEYDRLEKEYEHLTGRKYAEDFVPGGVGEMFAPVKHTHAILSLDKVNTLEELRAHLERLKPVSLQLKYDGLTLVDYNNGETPRVISTRGGGDTGEDVTATASKFLRGTSPCDYPVRMEAFLTYEDFEEINRDRVKNGEEPYKNLRNACSGIVRSMDNKYADRVSYVAYEMVGSKKTKVMQLCELLKLGYNTPNPEHLWLVEEDNLDEIIELIANFSEIRKSLSFEIDGLVLKSLRENADDYFGFTTHHPKSAIAYKFPSEGIWTTLHNIRWTVGRTGKVVPNALIKPVNLLNSTVSKATLHNASMVDRLNLTKGCEVLVTKCNDVIPGVVESRDTTGIAFDEPSVCPKCGYKLQRVDSEENEGVYQLYCHNIDCCAKTVLRTVHMAQKTALNISGLAEETVQKMYDDMVIEEPYDIFKLSVEDIMGLEGFAKASATKLHKAIQKAREVSLDRFLFAGGIPMIGKSTCELIAKEFGSYKEVLDDVNNGCPKISEIPGVGEKMARAIHVGCPVWMKLLEYVTPLDMVKPKQVDNALTFVITGTLPKKRSYYEDLIKSSGHKVSGSVSKKTSVLLAGEDAGSKLEKAQQFGTQVISTEEELMSLLK